MTNEDVRSELEKEPFIALRLHLVSGKTIDVTRADQASMLKNAVLITYPQTTPGEDPGYDVVALRNIERLEQIRNRS